MAKSLYCCVFLKLTVLAAMCTVAEIITKSVCEGDSVQIFQNISLARFKMKITLYKSDTEKKVPIATWFVDHSNTEDVIDDIYKLKVLFKNGIIMLRNIELTDEATYSLLYDKDNSSEVKETHISTLVAPTSHCKPKIKQEENYLIAVLDNEEYCGNPRVSVQWMEYPGISYKDKAVIVVSPGKDTCTYYACMEGEALRCTRNSTERKYCENITIGSTRRVMDSTDSIPLTASDIQYLLPITVSTVVIVAVVLIAMIASIIKWKCCRNGPKASQRAPSAEERRISLPLRSDNVRDLRPVHARETLLQQENIEMQTMH